MANKENPTGFLSRETKKKKIKTGSRKNEGKKPWMVKRETGESQEGETQRWDPPLVSDRPWAMCVWNRPKSAQLRKRDLDRDPYSYQKTEFCHKTLLWTYETHSLKNNSRIQNLYNLTFIMSRITPKWPVIWKIKKMEFVLKRKEKQGSRISIWIQDGTHRQDFEVNIVTIICEVKEVCFK